MGSWMIQHLTLRRSLGFIYKGAEFTLDAFDQYLDVNFSNCTAITRDMVVGYLDTTQHKLPLTRADHVSDLRQFCRFMLQYDLTTYIPEKGLVAPAKVQIIPHIFSKNDIAKLMQQAMHLNVKNQLLPYTYQTIIGLLWVTGMRIGEVIRLKIEDIDFNQHILYVRQTKFSKSRAIPLFPCVMQKLKEYLDRRSSCGYNSEPKASVFINNRGKPCTLSTTPKTLRTLMIRAELKSCQNRTPRDSSSRVSDLSWTRQYCKYSSISAPNP
ncbi:MAG: site-specific recombinase XerD [Parasphingorhabdus sp.]|jgi:site-specific recombinase XerD